MQAVKLTPKKVALAIGVSESSMKRWCDRGLIDFRTTAGGHRRLSQESVVDFVRKSKHSLIRSEMLGLPAGIRPNERQLEGSRQEFVDSIISGNEPAARQVLLELFLGGHSIASIADQIIVPAFQEVGLKWECGRLEVYQERVACEITIRVLNEIRGLLPVPEETAPLAMGGAPQTDPYSVPTMLVEMVFLENGWRSQSLGTNLPFTTLAVAAQRYLPRLFWLSVSSVADEQSFLREFETFRNYLSPQTFLAVGGRGLTDNLRRHMQYSAYGDNMKQMESLANSLKVDTPNFSG